MVIRPARYGDQKALIDIERRAPLEGYLTARPLGLILEWAALGRNALKVLTANYDVDAVLLATRARGKATSDRCLDIAALVKTDL